MGKENKHPVMGSTAKGDMSNRDWWPNQLNLKILHQRSDKGNPMGQGLNYAKEFKKLNLAAVKKRTFTSS